MLLHNYAIIVDTEPHSDHAYIEEELEKQKSDRLTISMNLELSRRI